MIMRRSEASAHVPACVNNDINETSFVSGWLDIKNSRLIL